MAYLSKLQVLQIGISFAKIILISIRPGTEALGQLPGTDMFCDINQYPMAAKTPGVVIIRIKSALLCFANAGIIKERYIGDRYITYSLETFKIKIMMNNYLTVVCSRIMQWVTEEAEDTKGNVRRTNNQLVVLDMSSKCSFTT